MFTEAGQVVHHFCDAVDRFIYYPVKFSKIFIRKLNLSALMKRTINQETGYYIYISDFIKMCTK